jgi:hypothetical protein
MSTEHEQGVGGGEERFFETSDDVLAAFLVVRGCQHVGLGTTLDDEGAPVATHLFDGAPGRLMVLVAAYVEGVGDQVPLVQVMRHLRHLERVRRDHALRLRSGRGSGMGGASGIGGWGPRHAAAFGAERVRPPP